tara:strand:- start:1480 stop:1875 length:396 start_codon:yes stop_codon:yes gene_type:complete
MTNPTEDTLLGSDLAAICARYGAPIRCEHERGVLRLLYEGDDAHPSHGSVELADGVVVSVAGELEGSRHHGSGQEMVGWPVEVVLPRLGKPQRCVQLGDNTRFEFARWAITVHEGTVACVVPLGESPPVSA